MQQSNNRVDLSKFDAHDGYSKGKPFLIEIFWYAFKTIFFLTAIPWPNKLKIQILRLFGAKIGEGVIIKPRVNIHLPWKLEIGNFSWIGEESWILNFELIQIGNNCCISQRAFLCGGNHDYKDLAMKYRNGPIKVNDGSWVGANVFVSPNVEISENCVITACSVVYKNLPADMICSGAPCEPVRSRWK